MAAARALAWWPHTNLSPPLYAARQESFARLRAVLRDSELVAVVECARELAACSDSNRWGEPYYVRKAAFARLRGALGAYDAAVDEGRA